MEARSVLGLSSLRQTLLDDVSCAAESAELGFANLHRDVTRGADSRRRSADTLRFSRPEGCSDRENRAIWRAGLGAALTSANILTSPVELPTLAPCSKLSVGRAGPDDAGSRVDSEGRRRSPYQYGPRPPGPSRMSCPALAPGLVWRVPGAATCKTPGIFPAVHRRTRVCQPGRSRAF